MLKTPTYDYKYWDLKFYYQIHVERQKAQWEMPLKYDQFIKRLKKMNLHDAIYTPRAFEVRPRKSKTPIQDHQRRITKLKENNVQIVTFEEMKRAEKKTNKIQIPKTKKIRDRFLDIFKTK